ncbi:MAG: hypothetical protein DMG42_14780 [Acidobacteria bacterium]|nr:MAG: hypothetical protein DMG42_14780 [Acidobacteriota bacterium]
MTISPEGSLETFSLLPTLLHEFFFSFGTRVEVSIWLVVTLCLIGGAIGGIAAKDTLKGSIWWRIFIGIVGAIVLVWLCVFAVVPRTHSMIAHSLISVFVVGIVGGYAGTRVLDFAAKRFGVLT